MTNLYADLAKVYEAMYQTFIDYPKEYDFYSQIIKKYSKINLLEIGSGTGRLAALFINNGFKYHGLDYSKEMIAIATANVPNGIFTEGDMRHFKLEKRVEGCIMTGRTISYLRTNQDINNMLSSVYHSLENKGIFCFDFIDANRFIPAIIPEKKVIHDAIFDGTHYLRKSLWTPHLVDGMDFQWASTYFKKKENGLEAIGEDHSIIRTFSVNELEVFLNINHFKVKEVIDKTSYAFPTYVIVAEKTKNTYNNFVSI